LKEKTILIYLKHFFTKDGMDCRVQMRLAIVRLDEKMLHFFEWKKYALFFLKYWIFIE
jgi:hypothetical protein